MQRPPICRSPDHPPEAPRDSMILIEEHRQRGVVTHHLWGCTACRDIRKIISVQVRTAPEFQRFVSTHPQMQQYKRARLVERDPTNRRVRYFR